MQGESASYACKVYTLLSKPKTMGCTGRLLVWFYGEQSCMWVAADQMELLGSYQDLAFGLRLTALRHWGRKQLKCALLPYPVKARTAHIDGAPA